jgi:transposase
MSEKFSTLAARVRAEKLVRDMRRAKRKHYSAEDKIRIVQKGRRDTVAKSLNDALSKKFSQTGGLRLAGNTGLPATSGEIKALRLQGMISPVGLQPHWMHFQNVALFTITVS